jgi:hypothetical protein
MVGTRYPITDITIETPRYSGGGRGGEHDIIGHGWVEIHEHSIAIAVHLRGAVGMLEPKEK